MSKGARWYVARFNLDERRKDEVQTSAKRLGFEFQSDLEEDYKKLKSKSNTFSKAQSRTVFFSVFNAQKHKMEAVSKRSSVYVSWADVMNYFSTKAFEFYKQEGLQSENNVRAV